MLIWFHYLLSCFWATRYYITCLLKFFKSTALAYYSSCKDARHSAAVFCHNSVFSAVLALSRTSLVLSVTSHNVVTHLINERHKHSRFYSVRLQCYYTTAFNARYLFPDSVFEVRDEYLETVLLGLREPFPTATNLPSRNHPQYPGFNDGTVLLCKIIPSALGAARICQEGGCGDHSWLISVLPNQVATDVELNVSAALLRHSPSLCNSASLCQAVLHQLHCICLSPVPGRRSTACVPLPCVRFVCSRDAIEHYAAS